MTNSLPLASRVTAFMLAVSITFFVGAGLEAETFSPEPEHTRSAQTLTVATSHLGVYALPTLSHTNQESRSMMA